MDSKSRFQNLIFGPSLSLGSAALAIMLMPLSLILLLVLMNVTALPVQAQTFKVIYSFTGGADGAYPYTGVTMDIGGRLYGTALEGGNTEGSYCQPFGCGTVYELTSKNGSWLFAPLYKFAGGSDGAQPFAPLVIGSNGSLYGTTFEGGIGLGVACQYGCGTVFNLRPTPTRPPTPLTPWVETVLYRFKGTPDGAQGEFGDIVFDQTGNIYGITYSGGTGSCIEGCGTAYELTPSNGSWAESILHSFTQRGDGYHPWGGVLFDKAGNFYGTTYLGGPQNYGAVYQLTPSGSGWVEQFPYIFENGSDGAYPGGGLIFDQSGDLYGTTQAGGAGGGGTVYELSPSGGGWTLATTYSFSGNGGSLASLTMDASGNLYGTTFQDGAYGFGNVFKLAPSNGGWTYTSLHDFTNGSDGRLPASNVILDANGNLYGTASAAGAYGYGVVWEITP